jgi:lipopolysaccharide export system ATP-binding protein
VARLHAQNITKQYGERSVVNGISLTVESGDIVGLLGPNGAGKTTSFYMIVGLVLPDSGAIFINDQDITALPIDQRAHLGLAYLPQEASVFRKLTVEQNLIAIIETRVDLTTEKQGVLLEDLLRDFRIEHIRYSLGLSLSGGERRRVEIARALTMSPRFMLLDEPFAGVDPISILDIQEIIKQLSARGIGVLITDHNVRETLKICDHAYIVNEGKMIAEGMPETVLANKQVKAVYLGDSFRL